MAEYDTSGNFEVTETSWIEMYFKKSSLFLRNFFFKHSDYNSPSYMAAVVQYTPIERSNVDEDLGEVNAKNYLKIINKAAKYVSINVIDFQHLKDEIFNLTSSFESFVTLLLIDV